jgi:hypothetical protein
MLRPAKLEAVTKALRLLAALNAQLDVLVEEYDMHIGSAAGYGLGCLKENLDKDAKTGFTKFENYIKTRLTEEEIDEIDAEAEIEFQIPLSRQND